MSSYSQLSKEIKKISDKTKCGDDTTTYSSVAIVGKENVNGFPYIDQVIYREWNPGIIFKSTSTVFHRVGGNIKWYKSKVDNNQSNPVFIDGVLNDTYWEPIIDFYDTNVFVNDFIYISGSQEFILGSIPTDILIVTVNGQTIRRVDYSVTGNTLTIAPPNVLDEDSEVTVIGVTGGITCVSTGEERDVFTWSEGDGYVFATTLDIFEAVHLFINGRDYVEGVNYSATVNTNQFTVTNMVLEEGDVIKFVYKVSAE